MEHRSKFCFRTVVIGNIAKHIGNLKRNWKFWEMSLFCFCKLTDSLDTSLTLIWNNLQMEASLFAGSCFCELSDDFASVLLEILVNLVTSCETLSTVRFAGVRAFAKMGCSPSQASKAYKVLIPCIVLYCM